MKGMKRSISGVCCFGTVRCGAVMQVVSEFGLVMESRKVGLGMQRTKEVR
jgi:hypothetical protein